MNGQAYNIPMILIIKYPLTDKWTKRWFLYIIYLHIIYMHNGILFDLIKEGNHKNTGEPTGH